MMPLRTLLAVGAVLLGTIAHADVYKCPDGKGGTIFRNMPCAGASLETMAPTHEPRPTSVLPETTRTPTSSPQETTDATCASLGNMAYTFALLRDNGKPASEFLALYHEAALKTGGAEGIYWEKITRDMILTIYANRWWTPDVARQRIEIDCFKTRGVSPPALAIEPPAPDTVSTAHLSLSQWARICRQITGESAVAIVGARDRGVELATALAVLQNGDPSPEHAVVVRLNTAMIREIYSNRALTSASAQQTTEMTCLQSRGKP